MALSRGTQNGPDDVDVRYVWQAFEEMDKCRLTVRMHLDGTPNNIGLVVEVNAWESLEDVPEVPLLGSFKTRIGLKDRRTIEAAILQALYALDGILAHEEFARVIRK